MIKFKSIYKYFRSPQFLVCVIVATTFWSVNRLSGIYTTDINIPIEMRGVSDNDKIEDKSTFNVNAKIKATGYSIVYFKYLVPKNYFSISIADIDMERTADSLFFELDISMLENAIQAEMGTRGELLSIQNRLITVGAKRYRQKTVPVIVNASIDLGGVLMQMGDIKINPCSVIIGGTSTIIDTIKSVITKEVHINPQNNNFIGTVKLIQNPYIFYSDNEISYSIDTERFSEKKEKYSVQVISENYKKDSFIVIPSEVAVTLNIPQSNYHDFVKDDLTLYVDYSENKSNGENKYLIKYISMIPRMKVVNIEPKFITVLKAQ